METNENIYKENIKYINKYTPEQWLYIIKLLYINYCILINDEEKENIINENSYIIKYDKGNLDKIEIIIDCKEDSYKRIKLTLDSYSIIFYKYKGHDTYEIENKIPIYSLRIMDSTFNK